MLGLAELRSRIVHCLGEMVRNRELTERALARATGLPQPLIHNVLKGKRELSVEMADVILGALNLDAHDLIEPPGMETALRDQIQRISLEHRRAATGRTFESTFAAAALTAR
jgi:transcriptional regulator with XRE-family HTH domain